MPDETPRLVYVDRAGGVREIRAMHRRSAGVLAVALADGGVVQIDETDATELSADPAEASP